jgi:hypothetical protein
MTQRHFYRRDRHGLVHCGCGLPFHSFCSRAGALRRRQRPRTPFKAPSRPGSHGAPPLAATPRKTDTDAENASVVVMLYPPVAHPGMRTAPPCRVSDCSEPAHAGGVRTAPSASPSGPGHPEQAVGPLVSSVGSERSTRHHAHSRAVHTVAQLKWGSKSFRRLLLRSGTATHSRRGRKSSACAAAIDSSTGPARGRTRQNSCWAQEKMAT